MSGCAAPGEQATELATRHQLSRLKLESAGFTLYALEKHAHGREAHVYIEGDGRPWIHGGTRISDDPTPIRVLALELMTGDPLGRLYLGRPCYFDNAATPPCRPELWTYDRFSETVVDSMSKALSDWASRQDDLRAITIVGHSGGGVLALLIGERVPKVKRVISLASPVDHDAWSELHGYTKLAGSINPARQSAWRPDVERILIFGARDENVPAGIFAPIASHIPGARVLTQPDAGHEAWNQNTWPELLAEIAQPLFPVESTSQETP